MSRRRFIARPGTPAASGLDIGITMTRVGEAPAAPAPVAEGVAPAYVGFADPPGANYFSTGDGGNYSYYAEFYGVTPDSAAGFSATDTGDGDPVTIYATEPINTGLILSVFPFTGVGIISVTALVNDATEYTAIFEIAPPE